MFRVVECIWLLSCYQCYFRNLFFRLVSPKSLVFHVELHLLSNSAGKVLHVPWAMMCGKFLTFQVFREIALDKIWPAWVVLMRLTSCAAAAPPLLLPPLCCFTIILHTLSRGLLKLQNNSSRPDFKTKSSQGQGLAHISHPFHNSVCKLRFFIAFS